MTGPHARQRDNRDGATNMSKSMRTLAAAAFVAAGSVSFAGTASALPVADGLALKQAAPLNGESVQWRGRGWGGGGWGGGGWGGGGRGGGRGGGVGACAIGGGKY